ncbi:MAG: helix-turn-helix domain-containing protein [Desulfovibrionaceae bacterium]|nr:helix-turn-helix domain-containing protein [Desulfovibrionaceae bacterium]
MVFATTDQHASGMAAGRSGPEAGRRYLRGLKAIGDYLGVSENTVAKYIRENALPAAKVGGGWEADVESLAGWRVGARILGNYIKVS